MNAYKLSRFTIEIPVSSGSAQDQPLSALYHTMTGAFILISKQAWSIIVCRPSPGCPYTRIRIATGRREIR